MATLPFSNGAAERPFKTESLILATRYKQFQVFRINHMVRHLAHRKYRHWGHAELAIAITIQELRDSYRCVLGLGERGSVRSFGSLSRVPLPTPKTSESFGFHTHNAVVGYDHHEVSFPKQPLSLDSDIHPVESKPGIGAFVLKRLEDLGFRLGPLRSAVNWYHPRHEN